MFFKNLMENCESEYFRNPFMFHFKKEKLCLNDYGSVFLQVKAVGFIIKNCLRITDKFGYIGICTKQNTCLPTLILGCLQIGRPFVYIDIENQPDFNRRLLENLYIWGIFLDEKNEELKHIIKAPHLVETFSIWDVKIQFWETGETACTAVSGPNMMFAVVTSGSTGKPKIVQVPEQSILPNILDLRKRWDVSSKDVILCASPPTFDPYMVDLLLAVATGAALLLVGPELRVSPRHMLDAVFPLHSSARVTVAQLTPSVFTRWSVHEIRTRVLQEGSALRILALGGEKFPPQSWWRQCRADGNNTQLYNLYGTTEVSCWATVAAEADDTLGSPLSDTVLRVVDETGQTVTDGTGEMLIGSETRLCLVEDETWESLKPPVFRATGDLVSVKNDRYKYVGRKDNVLKRWGHRVSLDAVEAIAAGHADVAAASCVLHADTLALYVSLRQGISEVDSVKAGARQMLVKQLNKASVPDVILTLDEMPLSAHGKVNKKKLKKILFDLKSDEINFRDQSDLFKILWRKYTCEDATEDSRFVSVGGNSVTAMLIVNAMALRGFDLPMTVLSQMLNNRSLQECWELMKSKDSESFSMSCNISEMDEHAVKRRKKNLSELMFVKMKGSTNNLSETMTGEVELKIAWSHNLGKCVDASPVCLVYRDGSKLAVVGAHSGRLAALGLESGELLWEVQLPDRIESSLTPSLCGHRGLVGCYDGRVYCISLDSGLTLWNYETQAMVKGSALTMEDSWIIGSYDYHVYCFIIETGKLRWKQKLDGIVLATPLHLPKCGLVVVATLAGGVAALHDNTGAISWSATLSSPVFSSPCVIDELVVIAEVDGIIHGLQASNGAKAWQLRVGGKVFSSLVAVGDSVVFGCHDGCVHRVSCESPSLQWSHPAGAPVYATPALLSPRHLVTASTAGVVSVVDIAGEAVCSTSLPGKVFSSPVTCGNFVVIGCRDDNIYCFEVMNKTS